MLAGYQSGVARILKSTLSAKFIESGLPQVGDQARGHPRTGVQWHTEPISGSWSDIGTTMIVDSPEMSL
ncbi:hypothetical protein B1987_14940 [Mycobacterium kansasii]|nr:hypothetical protein B1987_14940 [Mycobacterium kansasii]